MKPYSGFLWFYEAIAVDARLFFIYLWTKCRSKLSSIFRQNLLLFMLQIKFVIKYKLASTTSGKTIQVHCYLSRKLISWSSHWILLTKICTNPLNNFSHTWMRILNTSMYIFNTLNFKKNKRIRISQKYTQMSLLLNFKIRGLFWGRKVVNFKN